MATARRSKFGTLLVAVALVALVGTVSMLLAPQVVPEVIGESLIETSESIDTERAATVVAVVVTLCALVYFRGDSSTADHEPLVETPPEEATRPVAVVGAAFDARLSDALEAIERGDRSASETGLETTLEDAVCEALRLQRGCSRDRARSILESGEWTDDGVAAAFLAADAVDFPLRFRILRWLRPELAAERAVDRTVAELELALEGVSAVGHVGPGVEAVSDDDARARTDSSGPGGDR
ncbi:DUF7269 family protein [Halomontanus rarus]|uniref:DUF7269 family protein n=1 Tax=Halomontanus rarus TaxID=3034020 RepID=UPI0023E86CE7|nr:hypothetical protein [Halovivax sp. TS33]